MLTDKHAIDPTKSIIEQLSHFCIGEFLSGFDRSFAGFGCKDSLQEDMEGVADGDVGEVGTDDSIEQ